MLKKVDSQAMREVNRSLILDLVRREGRTSRSELARRSALTKPTVSAIVEELLSEGIVQEVGLGKALSRGGRRARLLELNADSAAYVGIHFEVDSTTVVVADAHGEIRATRQKAAVVGDAERSMKAAERLLKDALAEANIPKTRIVAVGVTLPGLIDHQSGACVLAPNLKWEDVPVRERMARALGKPVVVSNITQAAAIAEGRLGAARGQKSYVWIYVGSGVGAGLVLDGRLFLGEQGLTGEIGHCRIAEPGLRCGCGARGCLETVASNLAVERATRAALRKSGKKQLPGVSGKLNALAVAEAAESGNALAKPIIKEAGTALGIGVSFLANLLNPGIVVVGGDMPEASPLFLQAVERSAAACSLRAERPKLVPSALGMQAGIRGAVLMAMEEATRAYRVVSTTDGAGAIAS